MRGYPEPVTNGSFRARRASTAARDVFAVERIAAALALGLVVRLLWFLVERIGRDLSVVVPAGWATLVSLLVAWAILLVAPVQLSLEQCSASPLRLVAWPPVGEFGPMPVALRLVGLAYLAIVTSPVALLIATMPGSGDALDTATGRLLGVGPFVLIVWLMVMRTQRPRRS